MGSSFTDPQHESKQHGIEQESLIRNTKPARIGRHLPTVDYDRYPHNADMTRFLTKLKTLTVEESANTPFLMMPSVHSSIWSTFGDKLRVNGTLEEVCNINRPS